jgi:hypothetical protein
LDGTGEITVSFGGGRRGVAGVSNGPGRRVAAPFASRREWSGVKAMRQDGGLLNGIALNLLNYFVTDCSEQLAAFITFAISFQFSPGKNNIQW